MNRLGFPDFDLIYLVAVARDLYLLGVIALRRDRFATAGLAWGAAALLKIFPVYTAPILIPYLWRRGGWRALLRFALAGAAVFLLVSLPFYIPHPHGFLDQVFLMHGRRVPGRFGFFGSVYLLVTGGWENLLGTAPPALALSNAMSVTSFGLIAAALIALGVAAARRPRTEPQLLLLLAASLLWGLVFTKTNNEQYYILPLVLFAVAAAHPASVLAGQATRTRRYLRAASVGVALGGLFADLHFLTLVPPDVARLVFHTDVDSAARSFSAAFGTTPGVLNGFFMTTASLLMLLQLLLAMPLAWPPLKEGLLAIAHGASAAAHRVRIPARLGTLGVAFAALLLVPSIIVGLRAASHDDAPVTPPPEATGPLVGVTYRVDWDNPYHDPRLRYGSWDAATEEPLEGYFDMTSHRMREDLHRFHAVGYDYVLVQHRPVAHNAERSLIRIAAETQVAYAFAFDFADAATTPPLDPARDPQAYTERLAKFLFEPVPGYWTNPALLRTGPDQRVPLFLQGLDGLGQSSLRDAPKNLSVTLDDRARYLRTALAALPKTTSYVLHAEDDASEAEILGAMPTGLDVTAGEHLLGPRRTAAVLAAAPDWSTAYADLERDASMIRRVYAAYATIDGARLPAIVDGRLALDDRWTTLARDADASLLVAGWNDYQHGTALQPSFEYGDVLAQRTNQWVAARQNGTAAPTPWDPATQPIPPTPEILEAARSDPDLWLTLGLPTVPYR